MFGSLGDWLRSLRRPTGCTVAHDLMVSPEGDVGRWLGTVVHRYRWERASLFCRIEECDDLVLVAQSDAPPLKTSWKGSHPFILWLAETRKAVSVPEVRHLPLADDVRRAALNYFIEVSATHCIPLFWKGFVGLLNISVPRYSLLFSERSLGCVIASASALAATRGMLAESERLRRELALWDGTRRQFLSQMTDTLKTPLNSIIGLSDALASGLDGTLSEEQVGHLAMIRASGEELLSLINRLLDLGTLESEAPTLKVRKVNFERMVRHLVSDLEYQRGEGCWRVNLESELPGIYCDEDKIGRVLATLMMGASPGSEEKTRTLSAHRRGEMVEVTLEGARGLQGLDLVVIQRIMALHGGSLIPAPSSAGRSIVKLALPTRPRGL